MNQMDFELLGTDLATFVIQDGELLYKGLNDLPTQHGDVDATQWGSGIVDYGDYTYIYGSKRAHRPYVLGDDYNVARVPIDTPLSDLDSWEYRNGAGWMKHEYNATPVIAGELGSRSAILPRVSDDGGVSFITKEAALYGTEVIELDAPAPDGPFSESGTVATVLGYNSNNGLSGTSYLAFKGELPNGALVDMISKQGTGDVNLTGYGVELLKNVATS